MDFSVTWIWDVSWGSEWPIWSGHNQCHILRGLSFYREVLGNRTSLEYTGTYNFTEIWTLCIFVIPLLDHYHRQYMKGSTIIPQPIINQQKFWTLWITMNHYKSGINRYKWLHWCSLHQRLPQLRPQLRCSSWICVSFFSAMAMFSRWGRFKWRQGKKQGPDLRHL